MPLQLVPPSEPTPAEKVRQRIKAPERRDGLLQCNRCGGRTVLSTVAGVTMTAGRRSGGTKIDTDVCADCWKRGIKVSMLPELKPAT